MESVKPGTRCECRNCHDAGQGTHHSDPFARVHSTANVHGQCPLQAVRMVTVRDPNASAMTALDRAFFGGGPKRSPTRQIPMCEACAAFHEAKGA